MINGDLVLPFTKGSNERVHVALDGELLFNTVPWTDESDGALDPEAEVDTIFRQSQPEFVGRHSRDAEVNDDGFLPFDGRSGHNTERDTVSEAGHSCLVQLDAAHSLREPVHGILGGWCLLLCALRGFFSFLLEEEGTVSSSSCCSESKDSSSSEMSELYSESSSEPLSLLAESRNMNNFNGGETRANANLKGIGQ